MDGDLLMIIEVVDRNVVPVVLMSVSFKHTKL